MRNHILKLADDTKLFSHVSTYEDAEKSAYLRNRAEDYTSQRLTPFLVPQQLLDYIVEEGSRYIKVKLHWLPIHSLMLMFDQLDCRPIFFAACLPTVDIP